MLEEVIMSKEKLKIILLYTIQQNDSPAALT